MFRHDSPAEAEFRTEVRTWLDANLPLLLRGRATRPPPEELMPWYRTLSKKGWVAPHWPKQYGGMGATLNEQIIMSEELARIGACGAGAQSHRPDPHRVRQRGAKGATPAADHRRLGDLGAGLFRTWRRLRSGKPANARNA